MRIAIVNDVRMTVEVLKRIVNSVPDYDVAWVAFDGAEAVQKCSQDVPDLILMDLIMPVMDGVQATKNIMKNTPCAILVVTASVSRNISMVFEAMGFGALDAVSTPVHDLKGPGFGGEDLLKKIERIGSLIGKPPRSIKREQAPLVESRPKKVIMPPLLLIGSSTGGPGALTKILSHFPENHPFATVIIQHVDEEFAPGLARWLGNETSLNVQLAYEGATPKAGLILLAGKNDHLIMTDALTLKYTSRPADIPYHPSVDVFFHSVAQYWPENSMAVILTGMGADGAKGMKVLHDKGWNTIAQHQDSCVVYGMPKAAIEMDAVTQVLSLEQIGPSILSFFDNRKKEKR